MMAMPATAATAATAAPAQGPNLRDIHLPAEPSWWPPAPGWWVLATLVLASMVMALWWWRKQRRIRLGQQRIVLELDEISVTYVGDPAARMNAMHQLLRRVARQHDALAGQRRGEAWRRTLARVPVDAATLNQLLMLDQLIYQPPAAFDEAVTVAAIRRWLTLAVRPRQWKPAAKEQHDA